MCLGGGGDGVDGIFDGRGRKPGNRNRWACPDETRDISLGQFGPVEHAGICAEFLFRVFFTAPLAGAVYAIDDAAAFFIADGIEGAPERRDCDDSSATATAGEQH